MFILNRFYKIHHGHIGKVLNKWRNAQPWLDENIYDIASCVDPSLRKIRIQKDSLSREIINAENDIKNLFSDEQIQTLLGHSERISQESNLDKENQISKDVLKILRILRPNAPPSYRESSASFLDKTSKELIQSQTKTDEKTDFFTTKAFVLSIITQRDISELYSTITGTKPESTDNLFGLRDIINKLYDFIALNKDATDARRWAFEIWPKISRYFNLPQSQEQMANWLESHINRINSNSNSSTPYSLPDDFINDSSIPNETIEEERAMGIPRSKYKVYFNTIINLVNHQMTPNEIDTLGDLFSNLLITLEDLGLSRWINGDLSLETVEPLPNLSILGKFTNDISSEATSLIKALARGDGHLQENFPSPMELIDPKHLSNVENPHLPDALIDEMFSIDSMDEIPSTESKDAPFDIMYENHLRFHSNLGPCEYFINEKNEVDWRWKTPLGATYDHHREMYLRSNRGIDPMLRLDKLRCAIVERKQTLSMSKAGRMYFTRCIVAVGDGKGYFGMGVGHGANIADARNDGILNALKDMFFIDFDKKMPILTPVRGKEYGTSITITPRPLGKGLRISGRYLALGYLTGLDDCKISFSGTRSWITRMKALRRALEQIYSRSTMANATGLKYTHLFCPGDHTIHWPDRWFIPILNEYKKRISIIKSRRLNARKAVRRRMPEITPSDLKTDIPHYAYKSPLQKWQYELAQQRYMSKNVQNVQNVQDVENVKFDMIEPVHEELNYSIENVITDLKIK